MTTIPAPIAPVRSPNLPQAGEAMRVSATSDPGNLGGAIASLVRRDALAVLSAVGAAAVNQAVKGIAVAAGFLTLDGIPIATVPTFEMIEIDGNERTSIRFTVFTMRDKSLDIAP